MSTSRIIAALLCLISACGRGDKPVDRERAAEVARCAEALAASVPERGRAKLQTLIAGCANACPTLPHDTVIPAVDRAGATPVLEACRGFCTESARSAWHDAAPGQGYDALLRECGPESYGLTADSGPLLSGTWLFLLRVHEWLEQNRRHADKKTRRLLESAGMHAHFSLPLPPHLDGVYTLPHARHVRPMNKAFYVIAERAEGEIAVRAAAVPVARLRPTGLEQRPLPGGYFPGKTLAPGDGYLARYRMLEGMHPTAAHSTIDPTPAVLIDARATLADLLVVMRALERPEIALGVAGHTARIHGVTVRRQAPDSQPPSLRLLQDTTGFTLRGPRDVAIPGGDDALPGLAAAFKELAATIAPTESFALQLAPDTDIQTLVAIMDLVADVNLASVLVPDERASQPTSSAEGP